MTTARREKKLTKPATTLHELSQRMEQRLEQLKTLILWLGKRQVARHASASHAPAGGGDDPLSQLTASLRTAADALVTLVAMSKEARPTENTLAQDLARALALTGNGERFELTVESAIRSYCEARQEMFRYTHHSRMEESLRKDVVAGFARVVEEHRLELQLLKVQIEEVEPGTSFDSSLHEAIKRVPCEPENEAATIRHCVTPVFRWVSGTGKPRCKPARVIVNVCRPVRASTPTPEGPPFDSHERRTGSCRGRVE